MPVGPSGHPECDMRQTDMRSSVSRVSRVRFFEFYEPFCTSIWSPLPLPFTTTGNAPHTPPSAKCRARFRASRRCRPTPETPLSCTPKPSETRRRIARRRRRRCARTLLKRQPKLAIYQDELLLLDLSRSFPFGSCGMRCARACVTPSWGGGKYRVYS